MLQRRNKVRLAVSEGLFKSDDNKWHFELFCKNDLVHVEDVLQLIEMADKSNYFKQHFLVDKPQDLTKEGAEKKSIMKDWNEFLEHYQGDQIVDSKKSKFFQQEGQSDMPEKKKHLKIL